MSNRIEQRRTSRQRTLQRKRQRQLKYGTTQAVHIVLEAQEDIRVARLRLQLQDRRRPLSARLVSCWVA